jgi:hypothetical protein
MLDGELVAFLTIILGGVISACCYGYIGLKTGVWVLGIDAALSLLGNCFTLVPAGYFLCGVIIKLGQHLIWRGEPPVIPISGNEPTLVLVFAYAAFLCIGANFRIYRVAKASRGEPS